MSTIINMNKSVILGAALWLGAAVGAMAQGTAANDPKWKWPTPESKEQTARAKNARYTDSKSRGEYRDAANSLYWLLKNAPDLNPSIYINGVEIYDKLAEKEQDPAKKAVYQDSVLTLYDLRTQYFGDEASNIDRKAIYAYKYYAADTKRYPELYEILKKDADLNQGKIYWTNAPGLMAMIFTNRAANPDLLSTEEVFTYYDYAIQSLDNAAQDEALKSYQEYIDKYKISVDDYLAKTLKDELDCNTIEEKFGTRLDANPNDLKIAQDLYKMLRISDCTDSKYYMMSLETIYKNEKTFEIAKYMAIKNLRAGNSAKASEYLNDAISLAKSDQDKADLILLKAQQAAASGRKSEARSLAYQAVEANSKVAGDAYSFIGDLYMGSTECYKKESIVEDRYIFLAAYDMYQKAGDSRGMARAKAQFPSKGEIFDADIAAGTSVSTGCWIGATTTVRTRD